LCRGCRRRITDEAREFEIDGQYVHRRINPHGIHFEFFIFTGAPGCTTSSRPTEDFSWFDGYLWEIAACANCHEHLGWRFSSILGLSFYGLLCAKLTKETDD
jgi:hypothetical protein